MTILHWTSVRAPALHCVWHPFFWDIIHSFPLLCLFCPVSGPGLRGSAAFVWSGHIWTECIFRVFFCLFFFFWKGNRRIEVATLAWLGEKDITKGFQLSVLLMNELLTPILHAEPTSDTVLIYIYNAISKVPGRNAILLSSVPVFSFQRVYRAILILLIWARLNSKTLDSKSKLDVSQAKQHNSFRVIQCCCLVPPWLPDRLCEISRASLAEIYWSK